MALKLSEGQRLAVETMDKNILVSAAAGSGKTFVLTQRVISRIVDYRWNIDDFLIVTFTKESAGEMKEKIRSVLEKRFNEEAVSDNEDKELLKHIEKQLTLINRACISTIDSFCSRVLRQNLHKSELDLGFKNITYADSVILKKKAVDDVINTLLSEKDEDFAEFYNMYFAKNNDGAVENMIFELYKYADNAPYPEKWLDMCESGYGDECKFYDSLWGKAYIESIAEDIKSARAYGEKIGEYFKITENKPKFYYTLFEQLENVENALINEGFKAVAEQKAGFSVKFGKNCDIDEERQNLIKGYCALVRDALKSAVSKASADENKSDFLFNSVKPAVRGLVKAEKAFIKRYSELKTDRQFAEFNDISHSCLKILRDEEGRPTDAAKDYQDKFKEIIIDEYQDSNYLQEEILTAVSRIERGENNIFMVGDVKQAIYKFRQTTPQIFMDKYNRYSRKETKEKLILLSENYRSRSVVLNACNLIFSQIMDNKLGNVDYTDDVALNPKADFPKTEEGVNISASAEFIAIDSTNVDFKKAESDITKREGEAVVIAKRIHEMLCDDPLYIYDKDIEKYRPVEEKDIVILVRKRTNAGIIHQTLKSIGISCVFDKGDHLFETTEVKDIISLLRLIDNPLQDIYAVNLLHSPMYGLSYDDITKLRLKDRYCRIYNLVKENKEDSITLDRFYNDLKYYREYSINNSLADLINEIYVRSNYFNYVGILDKGSEKQGNLRLFKEEAIAFESLNPMDIHSFLEYIDTDLSDDVNDNNKIGSAKTVSSGENAVRIMTIHKSKGLEFPVVIVPLLDEKIQKDYSDDFVFDINYGIGIKYIDRINKIKYGTPPFDVMVDKYRSEEMSEALRLFYVAFTRAREKLILTGCVSDYRKAQMLKSLENFVSDKSRVLPYDLRKNAKRVINWVIAAFKRREFDTHNVIKQKYICLENVENIDKYRVEKAVNAIDRLKNIESCEIQNKYEGIINERLDYQYPYVRETSIPSKISITEIKRKMNSENYDENAVFYKTKINTLPKFMNKKNVITGAQRGTIYHTVFEHMDFRGENNAEKLLEKLVNMGILTDEERAVVSIDKINKFLNSDLFLRIKGAKRIYTESPFVMSIKASRLKEYGDSDSDIVVHGIIDLYFEEDEGIVIVDYKTDNIKSNAYELKDKYAVQLQLYKEAVEKNTGKNVTQCIIYSVETGDVVYV